MIHMVQGAGVKLAIKFALSEFSAPIRLNCSRAPGLNKESNVSKLAEMFLKVEM